MKRVAIIDCGTNTFHLLIFEHIRQTITKVHVEQKVVKIGEGGINNGSISEAAQQRALTALGNFKRIIDNYEVDRVFAFATSAFRNARNGHDLQEQVRRECAIDLNIIDGNKEAALIYFGVKTAMDIGPDPALVMDIGGGSVEFIIANRDTIWWKQSIEIGAQRLLDLFHHHDPMTESETARLNDYLAVSLSELLDQIKQHGPKTLIGSSGTFETLSAIYSQSENIHIKNTAAEWPLTLEAYYQIHKHLMESDREQRLRIPGMAEMRVDMIVVASSIIRFLLSKHPFESLRVSTYALKEGVLSQIAEGKLP